MEKDCDVTKSTASLEMNGRIYEDVDEDPVLAELEDPANEVEEVLEELNLNHGAGHNDKNMFPLCTADLDEEEPQVVNNLRMISSISLVNQSAEVSDTLRTSSALYPFALTGLNHVAFCCENLERSLEFYCGLLGLKSSPDRPVLQYRGAWLNFGAEGVHIMEVTNPDPVHGRPTHGGFDRHACFNCCNVENLRQTLDKAGIPYQLSMIPSIFCRDPDGNGLEFIEQ